MKDCAPMAARLLIDLGSVLLATPAQAAASGMGTSDDFDKLSFGVLIQN